MGQHHGSPCWYELGTTDMDAAAAFYGAVLGWTTADAGMEGFDYRLASTGDAPVAGMMAVEGAPDAPPAWMIYVAADDADATARAVTAAGGRITREPADIPGTGRYAMAEDPQGAAFGILQPEPMDAAPETGAFDPMREGHGNWHELMSTDPASGFEFYARLFGWTRAQALDMGGAGTYQIFAQGGREIGGMMGLGDAPRPCWLPYFGVNGVTAAIARITSAGGRVHHGPIEVPGGAFIAVASDPQGAAFAVVGPKEPTA